MCMKEKKAAENSSVATHLKDHISLVFFLKALILRLIICSIWKEEKRIRANGAKMDPGSINYSY